MGTGTGSASEGTDSMALLSTSARRAPRPVPVAGSRCCHRLGDGLLTPRPSEQQSNSDRHTEKRTQTAFAEQDPVVRAN
jgi:hypothetical protein